MGYSTDFNLELKKIINNEEDNLLKLNQLKDNISKVYTFDQLLKEVELFKSILCLTDIDILKILRVNNEEARFALNEKGKTNNQASWYEAKEDIKLFSLNYPEWLFILSGKGEESIDIWSAYILNGKIQLEPAKIVIEAFDYNKLV